jgi:hypothetical protein
MLNFLAAAQRAAILLDAAERYLKLIEDRAADPGTEQPTEGQQRYLEDLREAVARTGQEYKMEKK